MRLVLWHIVIKWRFVHSGMLDIDIQAPGNKVAVENIIYTDINRMPDGEYKFVIHNYSGTSGENWDAEIAFGDKLIQFNYSGRMARNEHIEVAVIRKTGNEFSVVRAMESTESTVDTWGITTKKFHKVNLAMFSPNFWDNQEAGNQHVFFILDKCINPDSARGFYAEFLNQDFHEDRAVFETLGSQLKAPYSEEQLSGLGFSLTRRASVVAKIRGKINRNIKINF